MTSMRPNLHAILPRTHFRWLSIPLTILMLFSLTVHVSAPATATASLTTCVDLATLKERISKNGTCRTPQEALARWRIVPDDSALAIGSATKTLMTCSNRESSPFAYQLIRAKCAKHMQTNRYTRYASLPAKPVITRVIPLSHESASLSLATDSATSTDAPITYFTISTSKGDVKKIHSWRDLTLTISGLRSSTSYTFTVSATNADGTSPLSAVSLPVTTQIYTEPAPLMNTAPVVAPAFNLSAMAETKTVGMSIAGYSLTSTGGTIANFSISPAAPTGTTFNTSTGLLSGTPTSAQTATAYTITATNSAGTATRTFTLTVSAVVYTVGQTGPGGGVIYYVATTPFACGPTRATTCNYLEVAPSGWMGSPNPQLQWASANQSTDVPGIGDGFTDYNNSLAIGLGYQNSIAIVAQGSDATSAAGAARAYTGGSKSDWYLPSTAELNLLCQWNRGVIQNVATVCTGGSLNSATYGASAAGFESEHYWSSSEFDQYTAWFQFFGDGSQLYYQKFITYFVRPVRAF
jgi:hypothetical protein